jgi:hypothetical protein
MFAVALQSVEEFIGEDRDFGPLLSGQGEYVNDLTGAEALGEELLDGLSGRVTWLTNLVGPLGDREGDAREELNVACDVDCGLVRVDKFEPANQ